MRQLAKFSVVAIIISTTSGCGWLWGDKGYFRDRSNDYLGAKQDPLLTIPANLQRDTRPFDPLYPIPNNIPNPTNTKTYDVPRPTPLQTIDTSSPFSLQNKSGSQWVIGQQSVMQTYQQALQYFRQAGFHIETARPATGEFTTNWAKVNGLAQVLSSRLLGVDASLANQELRVRVRVDPGVSANTSELYALVMTREDGSTIESDWPNQSQSSAIEAVILDELMANMPASQDVSSTTTPSDSVSSPKVSMNKKAIFNRDSQGMPFLVMYGEPNLVWSQVAQAINLANIKLDDMDRSEGTYYINLSEKADDSSGPGFFSRLFGGKTQSGKDAELYIVKVIPADNEMNIKIEAISDDTTVSPEKAESILKLLQENMN